MSVDIDATPDLLLLIQQKLRIVQYRYGIVFHRLCVSTSRNLAFQTSAIPGCVRSFVTWAGRYTHLFVDLDAGDGEIPDGVGDIDQRCPRFGVVDNDSIVFGSIRRQHDIRVPRTAGHVAVNADRRADHRQRADHPAHLPPAHTIMPDCQ